MKNLKFIFASFLIIGMLACEKENEVSEFDLETNLELTSDSNKQSVAPLNQQQRISGSDEIEINAAWAGFVLAKMLRYDENSARGIVGLEIANNGNTVKLSSILGLGSNGAFVNGFRTHIAYYIEHVWPDPDGEKDKPALPLGQNPPNPGNNQTSNDGLTKGLDSSDPNPHAPEVQEVMDILLDENCLEFYFPNGMSYSGTFTITSVAHPMNSNTTNFGIKRYYSLQNGSISGIGDIGTYTETLDVSPAYVDSGSNVIIVRPFKTLGEECSYSEYGNIDFHDFLR